MRRVFNLASVLCLTAYGAFADCIRTWEDAATDIARVALVGGVEPECGSDAPVCRWHFALGDPASRQVFEAVRVHLAACPDLLKSLRDQGVNHPDFYDAWAFRLSGGLLTLSLKDKSALQASFVVLRAAPKS